MPMEKNPEDRLEAFDLEDKVREKSRRTRKILRILIMVQVGIAIAVACLVYNAIDVIR